MNYSVLKPFSAPKPGAKGAIRPADEMPTPVGSVVDLGHLPESSIEFLTAEGCIEAAPEPPASFNKSTKGEK